MEAILPRVYADGIPPKIFGVIEELQKQGEGFHALIKEVKERQIPKALMLIFLEALQKLGWEMAGDYFLDRTCDYQSKLDQIQGHYQALQAGCVQLCEFVRKVQSDKSFEEYFLQNVGSLAESGNQQFHNALPIIYRENAALLVSDKTLSRLLPDWQKKLSQTFLEKIELGITEQTHFFQEQIKKLLPEEGGAVTYPRTLFTWMSPREATAKKGFTHSLPVPQYLWQEVPEDIYSLVEQGLGFLTAEYEVDEKNYLHIHIEFITFADKRTYAILHSQTREPFDLLVQCEHYLPQELLYKIWLGGFYAMQNQTITHSRDPKIVDGIKYCTGRTVTMSYAIPNIQKYPSLHERYAAEALPSQIQVPETLQLQCNIADKTFLLNLHRKMAKECQAGGRFRESYLALEEAYYKLMATLEFACLPDDPLTQALQAGITELFDLFQTKLASKEDEFIGDTLLARTTEFRNQFLLNSTQSVELSHGNPLVEKTSAQVQALVSTYRPKVTQESSFSAGSMPKTRSGLFSTPTTSTQGSSGMLTPEDIMTRLQAVAVQQRVLAVEQEALFALLQKKLLNASTPKPG